MTVQGDPVPNPPQHDPVVEEKESGMGRFSRSWMQWLLLLRSKINVINALLVQLSQLTGQGFLSLFDGNFFTRSFQGPMSVQILNGDGSTGDPDFRLKGDEASPPNLSVYGVDYLGVQKFFRPPLFESTGVLNGGTLSIDPGNLTFSISAVSVGMTDYTVPLVPVRTTMLVPASSGLSVPNIAVIATWVGIQMPGGTVVMQSSPFTATQSRTITQLGAVISDGTTSLIAVNNLPSVMRAGINQLQDFMAAVGPINKSGNVISPNGANLNINKSAGVEYKQGANFSNNVNDPHNLMLASLTPANFNYRLSTGTQFATTNAIDPNNWENPLGTLTNILGANRFTIQRIYVFTSNLIRIQYGQVLYGSLAAAEASLTTESFVTEANIAENGLLLAFLIIRDGTVDLTDTTRAKFIPASKFGGAVGSGGTTITNTDSLPEGLVNLYFTDARAIAAATGSFLLLSSVPSQTVGPGGVSFQGGITMLGAANNVSAINPTIQWRTETGIRRFRWQYAASDATDGNYNLDKWNGASFTNVLRVNTSATDLLIQGPTSTFTAAQHVSTIATGTPPLVVASTTVVPNLNADMVDGQHLPVATNLAQFMRGDYTFGNFLRTDGAAQDFILEAYGGASRITGRRAQGSFAVPTPASGNILNLSGEGYDGTGFFETASIQFSASAVFTNLSHPTQINFRTTDVNQLTSSLRWSMLPGGSLVPGANITYDVGTAALRPATVFSRNQNFSGSEVQSGVVTPATLAADVNDWIITDLDIAKIIKANVTGVARTATGIANPTNSQRVTITNISTVLDLILAHENTGSAANNRFLCPGSINYTVGPRAGVDLWYDPTTLRWRVLGEFPQSGTYAPVVTLTTNAAAAVGYNAQYATVGEMIMVSGKIDMQATAAGACEVRLSLPINATFATEQQLGGTAVSNNANVAVRCMAGVGITNQVRFVFNAPDTTNRGYSYIYMYQVP